MPSSYRTRTGPVGSRYPGHGELDGSNQTMTGLPEGWGGPSIPVRSVKALGALGYEPDTAGPRTPCCLHPLAGVLV
jgi:hypothetical protein